MKRRSIAMVLLVTPVLVACVPASRSTPLPTMQPPSPEPSHNAIASATSATKLARWQEYENALAAVFLPQPYLPGKGLCEWEVLGRSEQEVYVWAECQVDYAGGAAMSAPAVIDLADNGSIEGVRVPGDGARYGADIRQMFPKDLQQRLLSHSIDVSAMWPHLQLRHENPEPPLIVKSGTSLP